MSQEATPQLVPDRRVCVLMLDEDDAAELRAALVLRMDWLDKQGDTMTAREWQGRAVRLVNLARQLEPRP